MGWRSLTLSSQRKVDVVEVVPDKGIIGKQFRKDAKPIMEHLAGLGSSQAELLEKEVSEKGWVMLL